MKRLLKFFAFLGGLGAIGWLIRNRFVGMTMNREPETPKPAPEPVADSPSESDLARIPDLPPAAAELLHTAGVEGVAQLAVADTAELATRTGLDEGMVASWKEEAAALAAGPTRSQA